MIKFNTFQCLASNSPKSSPCRDGGCYNHDILTSASRLLTSFLLLILLNSLGSLYRVVGAGLCGFNFGIWKRIFNMHKSFKDCFSLFYYIKLYKIITRETFSNYIRWIHINIPQGTKSDTRVTIYVSCEQYWFPESKIAPNHRPLGQSQRLPE